MEEIQSEHPGSLHLQPSRPPSHEGDRYSLYKTLPIREGWQRQGAGKVERNGSHNKSSNRFPGGPRARELGSGSGESRGSKPEMKSGTYMGSIKLWGHKLELHH